MPKGYKKDGSPANGFGRYGRPKDAKIFETVDDKKLHILEVIKNDIQKNDLNAKFAFGDNVIVKKGFLKGKRGIVIDFYCEQALNPQQAVVAMPLPLINVIYYQIDFKTKSFWFNEDSLRKLIGGLI